MNAKRIKEILGLPLWPLVWLLDRMRIHPNILTLLGLAGSLCAAWLFTFWPMPLAALVMLAAGLLDTLDGKVARRSGKESRFGGFLDSSADRVAEFAIFGALMWRFRPDPPVVIVLFIGLVGSVMVSYTRARGEGLDKQTKAGPMSRAARYFYIILTSFLPGAWFIYLIILFDLLTWITVARRCVELYTLLSPLKKEREDPASKKERR